MSDSSIQDFITFLRNEAQQAEDRARRLRRVAAGIQVEEDKKGERTAGRVATLFVFFGRPKKNVQTHYLSLSLTLCLSTVFFFL